MAVVSALTKVSVAMKLNAGLKDDKVITQSVPLARLNIDRYNDQKAMNIVNLATPLLEHTLYETQKTEISHLTNS